MRPNDADYIHNDTDVCQLEACMRVRQTCSSVHGTQRTLEVILGEQRTALDATYVYAPVEHVVINCVATALASPSRAGPRSPRRGESLSPPPVPSSFTRSERGGGARRPRPDASSRHELLSTSALSPISGSRPRLASRTQRLGSARRWPPTPRRAPTSASCSPPGDAAVPPSASPHRSDFRCTTGSPDRATAARPFGIS
eukprot:6175295-Pleurochrysis_carterae.AAC.4